MIVYYKKTLRDEKIRELKEAIVGSWISLTEPTEEEIKKLSKEFNIPEDILNAGLDEEEIARIELEDSIKFFLFRIPIQVEDEIETIPFGVIITNDKLITICLKDHPLIADFTGDKVKGFYTTTKTKFLLQIIQRINYYFLYYLRHIERQADRVEHKLHTSVGNKEIIKLLSYERTLLYFNRATVANNNIIERLMKGNIINLYEEDKDLLDDISFDIKQAMEMISIYSGILSSTMDAYASIVSNNLNIVMKFLTVITVILSIPVVISSFFGMNVKLPLADHPGAFYIIFGVSLVLTFSLGIILAKKKYI